MKFFETLRKGAHNYISKIKESMKARAAENKVIRDIENNAAFEERKKQAVKTAKYRVQLKGKKDRELIKNPHTFGVTQEPQNWAGTFNTFNESPAPKQTKSKKQKKVQPQELFNPNTAMDMVNYNPFKTK